MSDQKKIKKTSSSPQRKSVFIRIIIGLVVVLAVASGIAFYFEQEEQLRRIEENKYALQKQLDQAYIINGELKALRDIVDTDEYVEKIARDHLGMIKPNEIVFEDQQ